MNKFLVAEKYQNCTQVGLPFENEKGRKYIKIKAPCPRCSGSGHYSRNAWGDTTCYRCSGRKFETKEVRVYSPEEFEKMQARNQKQKELKALKKLERETELINNSEKYKHEVALKMGFNDEESVYCVYSTFHSTYNIKDQLKAAGARFSPELNWHFKEETELP